MANILIPTDFSPASLQWADRYLRSEETVRHNLVLFHAFDLPASPHDLLGAKDPSCELMTEAFRAACVQLKEKYGNAIGKIVVRCMQGNTKALFRNFIDAQDIDLIYCPDDYVFSRVHARSLDPTSFFRSAGVPLVKNTARRREDSFVLSTAFQVSTS
jgi:hypothetical protein